MILKEIDPKQTTSKFLIAGVNAEKQMAFYLKRAYEKSEDIFVINDIRLQMNDDIAQIDHLVVHKFGFIIIESKSVSAKVSINEHDEWVRHYGKTATGMPSPVNQAKRQADFLKNFLMSSPVEIIKKRKLFPLSFTNFEYDTLVAISDKGIVERHTQANCENIYKADQITTVIDKQYADFGTVSWNPLAKIQHEFCVESLQRLKRFLLNSHRPTKSSVSVTEEQSGVKEEAPVVSQPKAVVKRAEKATPLHSPVAIPTEKRIAETKASEQPQKKTVVKPEDKPQTPNLDKPEPKRSFY